MRCAHHKNSTPIGTVLFANQIVQPFSYVIAQHGFAGSIDSAARNSARAIRPDDMRNPTAQPRTIWVTDESACELLHRISKATVFKAQNTSTRSRFSQAADRKAQQQ